MSEWHQQGSRYADEFHLSDQLLKMLHGTKPCVFLVIHHKDIGEVSLLLTIEYVFDGNQLYIVVTIGNVKLPNILVHNPNLFFP